MKNIFDIIFILIIGYIVYKLFFSLEKTNEYFVNSGLTPTPTLTSMPIRTTIVPGPAPGPSPSPTPGLVIVNGVDMSDYTNKYYSLFSSSQTPSLTPAPAFALLDIPALAKQLDISVSYVKRITPEQDARLSVGTLKFQTEFSKIYPIGTNFDALYDNYNNLISNSSIQLLNEILSNTKFKANQNSMIINFNPGLKQVASLYIKQEDIIEYGKYLVGLMNSVATIGNSFTFVKVNPIQKEQFENQLRVSFTIETKYKYPKTNNPSLEIAPSDFTLIINTVILFEKSYTRSNTRSYLETFAVLGISNFGYLSGFTKTRK